MCNTTSSFFCNGIGYCKFRKRIHGIIQV